MNWAREISEALAQIHFDAIPDTVIGRATLQGLDTVGVALSAGHGHFGQRLEAWLESTNTEGQSPVIGLARSASVPDAAFVNAALSHATDFDDTHTAAFLHPSATVWAAALANSGGTGVSGKQLLTAVISGYELLGRLGRMAAGEFNWRGFHTTSILGALASAVLTVHLRQGTVEEMASALSITTTLAAGLLEGMRDGSDVKMLQVGWAARAGVVGASLAMRGFVGPVRSLEGDYGLFKAHLGTSFAPPVREFFQDINERWDTLELVPKFYPACHHIHGYMDAAQMLRERLNVPIHEVESLVCTVAPQQIPVVCEPLAERRRPITTYAARFSLPYCVALALAGYKGVPGDFEEPRLREETVLALAGKVSYECIDIPQFPELFPAHLRLTCSDGQQDEVALPSARGQGPRETGEDDIVNKFLSITHFLGLTRQQEIAGAFTKLAETQDLSRLICLITAAQPV